MVICANLEKDGNAQVELLFAPEGSTPGERIVPEGHTIRIHFILIIPFSFFFFDFLKSKIIIIKTQPNQL
mgnify:CR=1 FL=1